MRRGEEKPRFLPNLRIFKTMLPVIVAVYLLLWYDKITSA
jgi:hypothetical protein